MTQDDGKAGSRPFLSVVIPAYNEEALIGKTLTAVTETILANQASIGSWELIVCDNNSSDRTASIAEAGGARVVEEPVNQISRARNTGAAASKGEWILFLDADTLPSDALIDEVVALAKTGKYVGCGSTIRIEGGSQFNKLRLERLNPLYRIFQVSGGAFLQIEAKAFHAIGGFSETLYALEEIDFLKRLKRHGRTQKKRFIVCHKHPVVSSGRKDELTPRSLATLLVSNFLAVVYFLLFLILPEKLLPRLSGKRLSYWYPKSRN